MRALAREYFDTDVYTVLYYLYVLRKLHPAKAFILDTHLVDFCITLVNTVLTHEDMFRLEDLFI